MMHFFQSNIHLTRIQIGLIINYITNNYFQNPPEHQVIKLQIYYPSLRYTQAFQSAQI